MMAVGYVQVINNLLYRIWRWIIKLKGDKMFLVSLNTTGYFFIFPLMTTIFCHLTILQLSLQNLLHERYLHCMLPCPKFCKYDLMMVK